MALFGKKEDAKAPADYYPLICIANNLREYRHDLGQKEVSSLSEIHNIQNSFETVLQKDDELKEKMNHFGEVFSSVGSAAGHFENVKNDIADSVVGAKLKMDKLRDSSQTVKSDFSELSGIFTELVTSVKEIAEYTNQITGIADQTNILAINASIEAARAGEGGKGFAVVATEVKRLAEQIKEMVSEVDKAIEKVSTCTARFNESIAKTNAALDENMSDLDSANGTFDSINSAAGGADEVQQQITLAADEARTELSGMNSAFDVITDNYRSVAEHIAKANELVTTKSIVFEYIDNMLEQIEPLVKSF